ncbi:Asp23/Gls24 family envelope stress response protein [Microlunatus flavus]|uniref:Uncharacterized conserved protein YloU, alkaline shock protein (Asp23) family n=1 Tax=Microlunatus flavus TaxID=1036181 RepID=A0A1H9F230_9ACTN|nr:Asp23/Gls24 family envelope stress response protein [Microlunatus flavus]SEQ31909.1 Uncharacterized conserved protein YloU, alkaline shock protein (Asp23) family [Microlunatus flavus]
MTAAPAATPATTVVAGPAAPSAPSPGHAPQPTRAGRVQQAAARAAEQVEGVHALGTATGRALVRAMGRVPGGRTTYGAGVSVEVGATQAAVDVSLVAEYGTPVPALADRVRSEVRTRVEREAGLEVVEVNVSVVGLHHPDDDVPPPVEPEPEAVDAALVDAASTDPVREADEDVQRIVFRAVEEAADAEVGVGDPSTSSGGTTSRVEDDRAPRDGGGPTVVLSGRAADGEGPDIVVADRVVLADEVVVVDSPAGDREPIEEQIERRVGEQQQRQG